MSAPVTCQVCAAQPAGELAAAVTEDGHVTALRVAGWRIWDGVSLAGTPHHAVLCPSCVRGDASRGPVDETSEPLAGVQRRLLQLPVAGSVRWV